MKFLIIGSPYTGKTSLIEKFLKKNPNSFFLDIRNYRKLIDTNYYKYNRNKIGPLLLQIKLLITKPKLIFVLIFFLFFSPRILLRFWKFYFIQYFSQRKILNLKDQMIIQDEGVLKKIYDSMPDELSNKKLFNWWKKNYKKINKKLIFTFSGYDKVIIITSPSKNIIGRIKKRNEFFLNELQKDAYLKRFILQQTFYKNLLKILKKNNVNTTMINNTNLNKSFLRFDKVLKIKKS